MADLRERALRGLHHRSVSGRGVTLVRIEGPYTNLCSHLVPQLSVLVDVLL